MLNTEENTEIYEFPVSPTQAAFWMMNQMSPDNPAYHIPTLVRIKGIVDVSALSESVRQLIQRHEILRTRYSSNEGKLVQRVSSRTDFNFHCQSFIDCELDVEKKIANFIADRMSAPFNLEAGEIVRSGLLTQGEKDHLFYLVVHHVAVDHYAMSLLLNELEVLYKAYSQHQEPVLAEPELQYIDYVMWDREQAKSSIAIDAWKAQLKLFSGVLSLPTNFLRKKIPSDSGAEYRFSFSKDLSIKIKAFSQAQGASLYQTLFSAFVTLMARLSGQNDVVVGTPFTQRGGLDELQQVVGSFINTLPIAVMVDEHKSFIELCAVVKKAILFGFEHQDVPFESIVGACVKRRESGVNPLFQTGFVFQEPPPVLSLINVECMTLDAHSGGAMYDLHAWMWEADNHICGSFSYDADLFEEQTISRWAENFETLLEWFISNPALAVNQTELASFSERQIMQLWNSQVTPEPAATTLPELIALSAKKFPTSIAVASGNEKLDYAELEHRASQMANYLCQQGVRQGDYVGISLNRSCHLLVGLLGILKAGAVYLPLDPEYPHDRLAYMLAQAQARVLVTESALAEAMSDFSCQQVLIDSDWDAISTCPQQVLEKPSADSLMYIIFTSGSTGLPKGVQVPHSAVVNFLTSMAQTPGLKATDTLLAVTTLSFDISVLELFLPLVVGAKVIIADSGDAVDGQSLAELLDIHNVSVMQATPSTWRLLVGAGWHGNKNFKALCGGEAFPRDLAADLLSRVGTVWNMYGPTETTVWSSCYHIEGAENPLFVGQPIGNTQFYVLNSALKLQPIGVAGELYIGGDGVTAGYLNRADLTAERFVSDVFRPDVKAAKLYRTGDLVRWNKNGQLEYLNRIDNQVKVRGYRIELEEIEQTLLKLEQIEACVVVVREFTEQDKRLVGYVKFSPDHRLTNSEVRKHLREYLPEYMVLQHLVEIDSIPLTANGKVDRKELPDPFLVHNEIQTFVAPSSDLEKALATIWKKAIGVEQVSADSNFFELGGHSMLALEVRAMIVRELGVKISTQDMLINTLEQLASILELAKGGVSIIDAEASTAKSSQGFLKNMFNKLRVKKQ